MTDTQKEWYYIIDDEEKGPVTESGLMEKFEKGELNRGVPIFCESMKRFAPASKVEPFKSYFLRKSSPSQLSDSPYTTIMGSSSGERRGAFIHRPWLRWWARIFDYLLFGFVSAQVVSFMAPQFLELEEIVLAMMVVFVWVFMEALLLSTWGTTPGKWLLKITLRDSSNNILSFNEALKRSFYVWSAGMGIGYPILSFVTLLFGYRTLRTEGMTRWDEAGGLVVTHQKVGIFRAVLTIGLFIALILHL